MDFRKGFCALEHIHKLTYPPASVSVSIYCHIAASFKCVVQEKPPQVLRFHSLLEKAVITCKMIPVLTDFLNNKIKQ